VYFKALATLVQVHRATSQHDGGNFENVSNFEIYELAHTCLFFMRYVGSHFGRRHTLDLYPFPACAVALPKRSVAETSGRARASGSI
jgi:hypothetical protein